MPSRELDILNAHPRLRLDKKAVAKVIDILDAHREKFLGGCPDGELSLAFLTDAKLAKLHDDFLDDPTTTDVITFEGHPELGAAGEICVSTPPSPTQINTTAISAKSSRSTSSTAGSTSPATTTSSPPKSASCAPPKPVR